MTGRTQAAPLLDEKVQRAPINLFIRPAKLTNAGMMTALSTKAFVDDPMFRLAESPKSQFAAEKVAYKDRLALIRRNTVSPREHTFCAQDPDTGEIIGFSGWTAPTNAQHLWRSCTTLEKLMRAWLSLYDRLVQSSLVRTIVHLLYPYEVALSQRRRRWTTEGQRLRKLIKAKHEAQGYWMLWLLGVSPEYAGKGIGSTLLTWGCEKADEEDQAIYLGASPVGVRLYERHGFVVVDRKMLCEGENHGPFASTFMCRPPRSQRA